MVNVLIQDTKRNELVLDSRLGDFTDVTLVCSDGILTHSSYQMLGMWSPVLRSTNLMVGNRSVVILPNFLKSTVAGVLELLDMKWEGEMDITLEEKNLLTALGIPIGNLIEIPMDHCNSGEFPTKCVSQTSQETSVDDPIIGVPQSSIGSEKQKEIANTEIFKCDLCDDQVSMSDMRKHIYTEHESDVGSPTGTEVQSYFRPCTQSDEKINQIDNNVEVQGVYQSLPKPNPLPTLRQIQPKPNPSPTLQPVQPNPNPTKIPSTHSVNLLNKRITVVPKGVQVIKKDFGARESPKVPQSNMKTDLLMKAGVRVINTKLPQSKSGTGSNTPVQLSKAATGSSLKVETNHNPSTIHPTSNLEKMGFGKTLPSLTSENLEVKCPKCPTTTFCGTESKVKYELRSHIGLNHYRAQLLKEVKNMFVEAKCLDCDKELKRVDQQQIHLLYNHTKWVDLVAAETDKVLKKVTSKNFVKKSPLLVKGIQVTSSRKFPPESKLCQVKGELESENQNQNKEIKGVQLFSPTLSAETKKEGIEKGHNEREIKMEVCEDVENKETFKAAGNGDQQKQNKDMKRENVQLVTNKNTKAIENTSFVKKEHGTAHDIKESTSNVLSQVDALLENYKETSPLKKAPDDVAEIQRKLLSIVGSEEDIEPEDDDDPDFEEIIDDEEALEGDIGVDEDGDERSSMEVGDPDENNKDVKKVQEELIKMQEISDDEDEMDVDEEDRMRDFEDEDKLEDVLNFKEEEDVDYGEDENDSISEDDDVVDISEEPVSAIRDVTE